MIQKMVIRRGENQIFFLLYLPEENRKPYPLIILSHGLGSNYTTVTEYAERFPEYGFACLIFDFCGGGEICRSTGTLLDMSVLTETEDLDTILSNMQQREDIDKSHIFLMGRSLGGYVSALLASRRPTEIAALILLFPAFNLGFELEQRYAGAKTIPETLMMFDHRVSRKYYEDIVKTDIYNEIGKYQGDVLLIHGDADPLVPLEYSEKALRVYDSAQLIVEQGGGHGFTGTGFDHSLETIVSFVQTHL